MLRTRRGFFDVLAGGRSDTGTAALLAARGHEAYVAELQARGANARPPLPPGVNEIRISSNENPLGPGRKVLDAITGKFPETGRYPFNSTPADSHLAAAIAAHYKVKPENVVLGAGSQEILKNAVRAFTAPGRGLVTASPTFENPTSIVKRLNHPLTEVRVDSAFRLDVEAMITASPGAGLVFFNNPNNPTATVHGAKAVADFVERVRKASPETVILIDEAYHDYVTDPSYASAVPLAIATPNVIVARTFSKAYGMAGLRMGYAVGHPDAIRKMSEWDSGSGTSSLNVLALHAGVAALSQGKAFVDAERARNKAVRDFTVKWFADRGMKSTDSHTNFIFVNTGMPAAQFRDGCMARNVRVGRDFPPFEHAWCRISLGTMDEMTRAVAVFGEVLGKAGVIAAA